MERPGGIAKRSGVVSKLNYNSAVSIVYAETSPTEQARRNSERLDPVPGKVIERMLRRWEPPDLTECHQLEIVLS